MPAHAAVFFAAPALPGTSPPHYSRSNRLFCLGLLTNVSTATGLIASAGLQNPSCRFETGRRGYLVAARAQDQSTRRGFFMFWQLQGHAVSFERLRLTSYFHLLPKLASILLLAGVIQGCAAKPLAPFAGPDPSDATARIPAVSYHSTIGFFATQRPVEPATWKKVNEFVAPAPDRAPEPKS